MVEDDLYNHAVIAQFYDIENDWSADFDYCANMAAECSSMLDLGCGTGMLAASLAEAGRLRIVGVDPAEPMLEIARDRRAGERVRWVRGDARHIRLDERFDLVVLTGHAFQVFLTAADRSAVLRTIAAHLEPDGRFIFDSRNPAAEAWRRWTPDRSRRVIEPAGLGRVLAWNDASHDAQAGIVTYETYYKVLGDSRSYSARSRIAFASQEELSSLIEEAGLVVERWMGDWSGGECGRDAPEIIPIGRLR
jgi:ubiquinone/menaquinone biosynthesis C-methylase UbiE